MALTAWVIYFLLGTCLCRLRSFVIVLFLLPIPTLVGIFILVRDPVIPIRPRRARSYRLRAFVLAGGCLPQQVLSRSRPYGSGPRRYGCVLPTADNSELVRDRSLLVRSWL